MPGVVVAEAETGKEKAITSSRPAIIVVNLLIIVVYLLIMIVHVNDFCSALVSENKDCPIFSVNSETPRENLHA